MLGALSGPPQNAICRKCGQRAPITLRGIHAICTACGARRLPFTAQTLNLAGKGSRIGGAAARFFGWASVVGGTSVAAFVALLLQSIWPEGMLGYAFAIPVWLISWTIGISLLVGGGRLGRHGDAKEKAAQRDAIRSLAKHRGGVLTAREVAHMLNVTPTQGDAMLTELAKSADEYVSLDLDNDGNIFYLFGMNDEDLARGRWRIATAQHDPDGQRADAEAMAYEEAERHRHGRRR